MRESTRAGTAGFRGSERMGDWLGRPTRRELLTLGAGAFVVAALPAAWRRHGRIHRRRVPVMGTLAEIAVVHDDAREAQAAIAVAVEELRLVDRTMSRYRADSDVGRVNLSAGSGRSVAVAASTAQVVEAALRWAEASAGAFDPCLGNATALWDVTHRTAPPSPEAVRTFAERSLWRALEVARDGGQDALCLHDRAAAIDLGGIAKGFGVDRAVAALRARGMTRAFVNAGGDLFAQGASEDGDPWRVGVRSPSDPTRLETTLAIRDEAVATSGDYRRGFDYAGRRYHHLLDPRTGEPRRCAVHSLTVVAGDCLSADAAATAAFGMEPARAESMLARIDRRARLVAAC